MAPWKGALCTARPPRGSSPAPRPEDQTHTLLRAWSAGFSALTFWKRLKRSWLGYLCVAAHAAPPLEVLALPPPSPALSLPASPSGSHGAPPEARLGPEGRLCYLSLHVCFAWPL